MIRPQIEVASGGTIYAAWRDDYVAGVKFIKSLDQGSTWTASVTIAAKSTKPNWSDKPLLAVSADGMEVYIAFNASDSYVAASQDYGDYFEIAVDAEGRTHLIWGEDASYNGPGGTWYTREL